MCSLSDGATPEQILADFPALQAEDIRACLAYAASYFDHPVLVDAQLPPALATCLLLVVRSGALATVNSDG